MTPTNSKKPKKQTFKKSLDKVDYEDINRRKYHSFIRIDDAEPAIVDSPELLKKLRLSALQSEEKERQRLGRTFKNKMINYREFLESELTRIILLAQVDRAQAGSILHNALNDIKKDFYNICLDDQDRFLPSQELIQTFITKAIKAEQKKQRLAKEKIEL